MKIFFGRYMLPLVVLVFFSSFKMGDDFVKEIILQDEPLNFTPSEFYIKNISDQRENTAAVAFVLQYAATANGTPQILPVDLKSGGLTAVRRFINHNLGRNTALRPVNMTIKKFGVYETSVGSGIVEGHISVSLSYDLADKDAEDVHLIDYNGSAVYTRKAGNPQEVEPSLRHLLVSGLAYFNTWINRQALNDVKLAKGINVIVTDDQNGKPEGDSIYYDVKRPLTWDDFQSKTASRRFDAEVFPSFGYFESTNFVNGIVNVTLRIRVFLPKSSSWVKDGAKNAHTLNHEQRHFDITKIIAEQFKEKLKKEGYSTSDFDATINMLYLDMYRELHTMQLKYDNETRHGTYEAEQARWDKKITDELGSFGTI